MDDRDGWWEGAREIRAGGDDDDDNETLKPSSLYSSLFDE